MLSKLAALELLLESGTRFDRAALESLLDEVIEGDRALAAAYLRMTFQGEAIDRENAGEFLNPFVLLEEAGSHIEKGDHVLAENAPLERLKARFKKENERLDS